MKVLKVFIYNCKNGELIKEHLYSDFVIAFNDVIAHNYLHEDENNKRNIFIDFEYPSKKLNFVDNQWQIKNNIINKNYTNLIKFFE
jgi:cytochrome b involved in lipid metabolism